MSPPPPSLGALNSDELLRHGEVAEQSGDLIAAIAAYEGAAEDDDARVRAQACFRLGRVSWRQARYDAAIEAFRRARVLATQLADEELRARTENGVGAVHYARGEYAKARSWYGKALARSRDDAMRARILVNLGVIANIEGRLEEAERHYAQSRAVFAMVGDSEGEALALHNLGMVHADLGQWPHAHADYQRCLHLFERLGNRAMVANVFVNRAELAVARGQFAQAVTACDRAVAIYVQLGDQVGLGEALRWKGRALHHLGELARAERSLNEAVQIAHRTQAHLLEADASRELATVRASLDSAEKLRKVDAED